MITSVEIPIFYSEAWESLDVRTFDIGLDEKSFE